MKHGEHGGNIYAAGQRGGMAPTALLDYSANINPLGLHPAGKAAVLEALDACTHYPDPAACALRQVIEDTYGMPSAQVALGNGAAELIYALPTLPDVERVTVTAPAFSEYVLGAEAQGKPVEVLYTQREHDFEVQVEDLAEWNPAGSMLFLGHPNNPDGQLLSPETLRYALEKSKGQGYVVVDESFIDFIGEDASYRSWLTAYPHLILIHSYTKFYAIPGLRLGAVYAAPSIVAHLEKHIPAWSVNVLAQAYGVAALADSVYREKSRALLAKERAWVYEIYQQMPQLRPIAPAANFMLIEWRGNTPLADLEAALWEEHILVRNANNYENLTGSWFRIAIRTRKENERLWQAIRRYIERSGGLCSVSI